MTTLLRHRGWFESSQREPSGNPEEKRVSVLVTPTRRLGLRPSGASHPCEFIFTLHHFFEITAWVFELVMTPHSFYSGWACLECCVSPEVLGSAGVWRSLQSHFSVGLKNDFSFIYFSCKMGETTSWFFIVWSWTGSPCHSPTLAARAPEPSQDSVPRGDALDNKISMPGGSGCVLKVNFRWTGHMHYTGMHMEEKHRTYIC